MTEPAAEPVKRLWTPHGFREDEWRHAETAEAAMTGNARTILPLKAFLDLSADPGVTSKGRFGVLLLPGEALEAIVPHLRGLSMVALAFPAFNDGRSFSKAELLRSRHEYAGTVRATGQVLIDQLSHMIRVGFDEFEVSHPVLIARLEAGIMGGIAQHYQPAASDRGSMKDYAWRRIAGT